jgi:hypothetical protein
MVHEGKIFLFLRHRLIINSLQNEYTSTMSSTTLSSELFMVSHPHRQVGSLWSHTHIVKWVLYGLTPTSSSELFMVSHPHRQVSSLWSISYCKYRNKFGQLGIRNRIEYVIFYLFLVNIIGNCHENKYI